MTGLLTSRSFAQEGLATRTTPLLTRLPPPSHPPPTQTAATTRGLATRVATLMTALEDAAAAPATPQPATIVDGSAPGAPLLLRTRGLAIATPDGASLLKSLDLELAAGQRVLLCGPNGAGKSSLLRVLSGVWPAAAGGVEWFVPASDRLVLPQRPYLLPTSSLKQNLLYPASEVKRP